MGHSAIDRPLIVLGATATGKSSFAVELAERVGAEIVSFDASCVYRGLSIGTAKPSLALRARVPHHGLDACDPADGFTVARFVALADAAVADMAARGRRAVLVGGTGLYLRCWLRGLAPSPAADHGLRARLRAREERRPGFLHALLRRCDPAAAALHGPRDGHRLVRALEHRLLSGSTLSAARTQWAGPERGSIKIGLRLPRDERSRRIERRVDAMLEAGLVAEVESLLASGVPPTAPGFRAIGYRDVVEHLEGRCSLDEVRARVIAATRRYAKRQDTWFRREPDVEWIESPADRAELQRVIDRVTMATRGKP